MSTEIQSASVNKRDLAGHYGVGVRTIENWVAWQIISGRLISHRMTFDPTDCDHRLFEHTKKGKRKEQNP